MFPFKCYSNDGHPTAPELITQSRQLFKVIIITYISLRELERDGREHDSNGLQGVSDLTQK